MAGVKEKVHLPIYDSIRVEPRKQLRDVESSSTLKFFAAARGKTKLETNAPLFRQFDSFSVHAMRVVISDLPPEFPVDVTVRDTKLVVSDENDLRFDGVRVLEALRGGAKNAKFVEGSVVTADVELSLRQVVDLFRSARTSEDGCAVMAAEDPAVKLESAEALHTKAIAGAEGVIRFSTSRLEGYLAEERFVKEEQRPLREQVIAGSGAGSLIAKIVYNTVTTLFVGEKVMIQMPTWFFPGGAGPRSDTVGVTTHGEPTPSATFRFAEPIVIDKQQNFRVEIEVPHADFLKEMQRIYGPLFIWVVLDGEMTRDVP